uniref:Cytochrome P450 n=1 Tax=Nocardiopsis sp. CMB-M0232 TaxID=1231934 RepID=A0A0R7QTS1_9ACTN|nr:cytochrome P450 [Nocardiopsis sp. CMB-M0232]
MSDSEAPARSPFSHPGDAPGPRHREIRQDRPITPVLTRAGDPAWLITSHELAVRALQDGRLFAERFAAPAGPGRNIPAIPASAHAALAAIHDAGLHKVVMRAIAPPRARKLRPWVRATARARLDALAAGPRPAELSTTYARALPIAVAGHVMGIPGDDAAALGAASLTGLIRLDTGEAGYAAAAARAHDYFRAVLARPRLPDGIVRRFREHDAARPPAERVGDDVLAGACVNVLSAVHDGGLPRVATEDVEIGGVTIGAGELVLIGAATADRDPAAFPGPDRIGADRAGQGYPVPGRGTHDRPGGDLGRMVVQVAVEELTRRLPTMRPAVPADEVQWRTDLPGRPPAAIPVTW